MSDTLVLVLAAGEGKRMRSSQAKVLHQVAGRSLIGHVLTAVSEASPSSVAVIVGAQNDYAPSLTKEVHTFAPHASLCVQDQPLGTAHAVLAARHILEEKKFGCILVVYGDTPLLTTATCRDLCGAINEGHGVALLGFQTHSPAGYGRLIQNEKGNVVAIREEKDATPKERQLTFCNGGALALHGDHALSLLDSITNTNANKEYYLTDCVGLATDRGLTCALVEGTEHEVLGVNDRLQLAQAETLMQKRLRQKALEQGVTLRAPETIFLSVDTQIGRDSVLEPYVICGPGVTIDACVTVRAFSYLENVHISSKASVGPFARIRDHTFIGSNARIGNFVEVKKTHVGSKTKINHLAYVGDATVGTGVNIGAGTITCNYDGRSKHTTTIEDGAFIGSNSSLVAPVTIGASALIGSGSVITQNVPPDALAIGRSKQSIKEGWAVRFWRRKPSV
jgi:bifunctional UDP-N-acetylglucosamine pyrophosphorylase/glucosamine-1-phosphate N-acetyltransferase